MKTGAELIADERARQTNEEGWIKEHDAKLEEEELAYAAICYAFPNGTVKPDIVDDFWPWESCWWKPTPDDRIRELVKSGALIAAEIDRLQAKKEGES